ncbi:MAG: metalloprotease TldD, partial [Pseudomonadota bacterium]
MSNLDPATIFYTDTGLDPGRTERLVADALNGCDDGELYLQYAVSESFAFDDGRLKAATFDTQKGFGLRGVAGEMTAFAHANELSDAAIRRAADTIRVVRDGHGGTMALAPPRTNARRYTDANPL